MQIMQTSGISSESRLKLTERPRVVHTAAGTFHPLDAPPAKWRCRTGVITTVTTPIRRIQLASDNVVRLLIDLSAMTDGDDHN